MLHLPSGSFPYEGKQVIQVRRAGLIPANDAGWTSIIAFGNGTFRSTFHQRNALNIPGPFYGAETDTCETGVMEAPRNVLLDQNGQEFVFEQPSSEEGMRDVLSAALCECFIGYGADGDDHWTLSLIRDWWASRHELLSQEAALKGSPESILAWRRLLIGEAEPYLRAYAYFVEERRMPPTNPNVLPEVS